MTKEFLFSKFSLTHAFLADSETVETQNIVVTNTTLLFLKALKIYNSLSQISAV